MRDLLGRVAVITGAASGIGRAMALRFGRAGMKLVLADIDLVALEEVRDLLVEQGSEAVAWRTDVSKSEEVEELARRARAAFGQTHVLCNNAGVASGGFVWEIPANEWSWCFGVNFWGVVHGIRAFVPGMIAKGEGHVVNTASLAGLITGPGMAPYFASKHGVVALSECLHHDLALATGGKVKVSLVCPAWVKTGIADSGRHRPAPPSLGPRSSSAGAMMRARIRTAVDEGIPPENVADQVHRAVVEERFWVLTHPERNEAIAKRTRGILEGTPPVFDPDT